MDVTQLSLIPLTSTKEEKNRNSLLEAISKKGSKLKKLVVRSEMLKVRLDMLKGEYMVKIGSLVLKDNHLDLEIIRQRNILRLMKEGKSYEEAVKTLASTFYSEQLEMEKEEEKIRMEEEKIEKRQAQQSKEIFADTKKLWKRLIALFHPDLTQDPDEKKRRDEIMKEINHAYEQGDFLKLAAIERENALTQDTPTKNLEEILVQIEQEIIEQEKLFAELKKSEWYRWDQKISRTRQTISDIFKDVEKKLLDDIVTKIDIIKSLEEEIKKMNNKSTSSLDK